MTRELIADLIDAIELHLGSAIKSIQRGLLLSSAAFLLLWLISIGAAPSTVPVPGLDFAVPSILGSLLLILGSTIFGIAAAARVWRARSAENIVSDAMLGGLDEERDEIIKQSSIAIIKRSPLIQPIVLFCTIVCLNLLNVLYFQLLTSMGDLSRDATWFPEWFFGFSLGYCTTLPFWFVFFVRIRHLFRQLYT